MGGSYFDIRSFDESMVSTISTKKASTKNTVRNILVADDSIMVRKEIGRILENGKFNVIESCIDGQDAVNKYKNCYPEVNLVTMDVSMPGMDSLEALKLILEFDAEAKVVMICSLGKETAAKKAVELGAKGYIVKPLIKKTVLDKIALVLKSD